MSDFVFTNSFILNLINEALASYSSYIWFAWRTFLIIFNRINSWSSSRNNYRLFWFFWNMLLICGSLILLYYFMFVLFDISWFFWTSFCSIIAFYSAFITYDFNLCYSFFPKWVYIQWLLRSRHNILFSLIFSRLTSFWLKISLVFVSINGIARIVPQLFLRFLNIWRWFILCFFE